jgi:GDP-L-fucose synthase
MKKDSRIFIAGHKGLVGSAVYRNLISKGYKKLFIVNKNKLDLKDKKKTETYLKKNKIEYLIICAAKAGGIVANKLYPVEFFNENILIQNSLLNSALSLRLKRTIFLGTSCIYPNGINTLIKENDLLKGPIHETNEAYAIAKIAGIKLCKAMYNQYGLDVVALMPTNIYGLNDKYDENLSHVIPSMLIKFINAKKKGSPYVKVWGNGKPLREFLSSDDLAEAIFVVLKTSKSKLFKICSNSFPIINIGSGDIYSIKELAFLIKRKIGYEGQILFNKKFPNGVIKKNLNYDRIKKLNWSPKIKLVNSLDSIISEISFLT